MFHIYIEMVVYVGVDRFLDFWCGTDLWLLNCHGVLDIIIILLGFSVWVVMVVGHLVFPQALVGLIEFPRCGNLLVCSSLDVIPFSIELCW